jgi:hypothetical protein
MRSLSPPAASSGLVAPLPTTRLSNRPGLRTAANNNARVPTSGPTACMRSIPRCCASLMTKSPIASGDIRSGRLSDRPKPGRSTTVSGPSASISGKTPRKA